MKGITFKNVYKIYNYKVTAVSDFNLEVNDKEFVVFVGPSGCGKSTTLRMLAGLEEISKGEIYIDDVCVNNIQPKDRDIAMVFQNYALYPHMTVRQNMEYALKLRKMSREEIDKKTNEAARILGLEEYMDRKPRELSGGQRQRVALGRAIVRNPKVFLMDEPLSNLDAKLRVQTRAQIINLHRELETTFIYVTHDQTEAMTMGDRIVVMKDGVVQQVDTPHNIYFHPINLFVAGFIGSPQMNFIDCSLDLDKGLISLLSHELTIEDNIVKRLEEKGLNHKEVVLGIRPEHLSIKGEGSKLTGKIQLIEMLGSEKFIHVDVEGKEIIVIINSDEIVERGQIIDLYFDHEKIQFFDKETKENYFKLS